MIQLDSGLGDEFTSSKIGEFYKAHARDILTALPSTVAITVRVRGPNLGEYDSARQKFSFGGQNRNLPPPSLAMDNVILQRDDLLPSRDLGCNFDSGFPRFGGRILFPGFNIKTVPVSPADAEKYISTIAVNNPGQARPTWVDVNLELTKAERDPHWQNGFVLTGVVKEITILGPSTRSTFKPIEPMILVVLDPSNFSR
jgi:hypothetical protein